MKSTPVRLHKKPAEPKIIVWINSHAYIIMPVCIFVLLLLMVWLAYAIVGVSATDSGVYCNHFKDVI